MHTDDLCSKMRGKFVPVSCMFNICWASGRRGLLKLVTGSKLEKIRETKARPASDCFVKQISKSVRGYDAARSEDKY